MIASVTAHRESLQRRLSSVAARSRQLGRTVVAALHANRASPFGESTISNAEVSRIRSLPRTELAADQSLDGVNGVRGVSDCLAFRDLADQSFALCQ
jgi:hypothetical protein